MKEKDIWKLQRAGRVPRGREIIMQFRSSKIHSKNLEPRCSKIWKTKKQEIQNQPKASVSIFRCRNALVYKHLAFKVHEQENQLLNYVSRYSVHTQACFASIISEVVHRLSVVTTVTPENQDNPISQLYPDHVAAVERANLIPPD